MNALRALVVPLLLALAWAHPAEPQAGPTEGGRGSVARWCVRPQPAVSSARLVPQEPARVAARPRPRVPRLARAASAWGWRVLLRSDALRLVRR